MSHCLAFTCVSSHPEVFEPIKAMPALDPFTHVFTVSALPDPALAGSADVIFADLREMEPGGLQVLLSRKKESAQLILLADLERFKLTADRLAQVTDLWALPMTEDELRFRFLRWQQAYKQGHELDAARAAQKAKSAFLSSVSHDIRTPVNAIMGLVTLLRGDAGDSGRVLEYAQQIETASHHLLSLVNDVLDMNKLENGAATLNLGELRLADIIDEINAVILPQAKAKEQSFEIRTSAFAHECLVGDKLRIIQILINILSNAVKYTQKGGAISMAVTELPQTKPGVSRVRFTVTDNGQGMSEDSQKLLFHPFAREQDAPVNQVHGSGLGMPITKSLVELMDGSIQVESRPGQGSTFTVELELRVQEKKAAPASPGPKDVLRGKRVLVVDDIEVNRIILTKILSTLGAQCDTAVNGQIAVEKFLSSKPGEIDLIMMDIQMPVMDGYTATRTIRASNHPSAQSIPVVAITANALVEDVREALKAGMDAHIAKPVVVDKLLASLRDVFAQREK